MMFNTNRKVECYCGFRGDDNDLIRGIGEDGVWECVCPVCRRDATDYCTFNGSTIISRFDLLGISPIKDRDKIPFVNALFYRFYLKQHDDD